jgi:hypothetical protein
MKWMNKTATLVLCSVLFQVYWFGLVWSAGKPVSLLLAPLCAILCLAQLWILSRPFGLSLAYVLVCTLCGGALDTLYSVTGTHVSSRILVPDPFIPLWMAALWAAFATYIRTSLGERMRERYVVQFLLGLVCGPLAWLGGARMGAVQVSDDPFVGYGIIALSWGVGTVALFRLSEIMKVKEDD